MANTQHDLHCWSNHHRQVLPTEMCRQGETERIMNESKVTLANGARFFVAMLAVLGPSWRCRPSALTPPRRDALPMPIAGRPVSLNPRTHHRQTTISRLQRVCHCGKAPLFMAARNTRP
jgi:hypothetical protein